MQTLRGRAREALLNQRRALWSQATEDYTPYYAPGRGCPSMYVTERPQGGEGEKRGGVAALVEEAGRRRRCGCGVVVRGVVGREGGLLTARVVPGDVDVDVDVEERVVERQERHEQEERGRGVGGGMEQEGSDPTRLGAREGAETPTYRSWLLEK